MYKGLITKYLQNAFTEMYHNCIGDSNRTICWPLLKGTALVVFHMVALAHMDAFSTGASATYTKQISINVVITCNLR